MMNDEQAQLSIPVDKIEPFVICLALGTLREMRDGNLPLEAGIWTLGRPVFSRRPEVERSLSAETRDILRAADEVDAMASLGGVEQANQMLDEMILALQNRLTSLEDPCWFARWTSGGIGQDDFETREG